MSSQTCLTSANLACLQTDIKPNRDAVEADDEDLFLPEFPTQSPGSPSAFRNHVLEGISIANYRYSQLTADRRKASMGIGTSACGYIQSKLMVMFSQTWQGPYFNKRFIADSVNEYAEHGRNNGTTAFHDLSDAFRDIKAHVLEGDLEDMLCSTIPKERLFDVILRHAHAHAQLSHSPVVGILVTSPKNGSSDVGNSYGIYIKQQPLCGLSGSDTCYIKFIDTHSRSDVCGAPLGMVAVTLGFKSGCFRHALRKMLQWFFDDHVVRASLKPEFQLASVSTMRNYVVLPRYIATPSVTFSTSLLMRHFAPVQSQIVPRVVPKRHAYVYLDVVEATAMWKKLEETTSDLELQEMEASDLKLQQVRVKTACEELRKLKAQEVIDLIAIDRRFQEQRILITMPSREFIDAIVADLTGQDIFGQPAKGSWASLKLRADMTTLHTALKYASELGQPSLHTVGLLFGLHLVHRRQPVSSILSRLATVGLRFEKASFKDILLEPLTLFAKDECVWDTKAKGLHPCGGPDALEKMLEDWTAFSSHVRAMVAIPAELWRPVTVHEHLARDIRTLGESAPYHRGHHLRFVSCFAGWLLKGDRPRMQEDDWELLLSLLPGTRRNLEELGLCDFNIAASVVNVISGRAGQTFDLYDLSSAACLKHSRRYHLDQGIPFRVRTAPAVESWTRTWPSKHRMRRASFWTSKRRRTPQTAPAPKRRRISLAPAPKVSAKAAPRLRPKTAAAPAPKVSAKAKASGCRRTPPVQMCKVDPSHTSTKKRNGINWFPKGYCNKCYQKAAKASLL